MKMKSSNCAEVTRIAQGGETPTGSAGTAGGADGHLRVCVCECRSGLDGRRTGGSACDFEMVGEEKPQKTRRWEWPRRGTEGAKEGREMEQKGAKVAKAVLIEWGQANGGNCGRRGMKGKKIGHEEAQKAQRGSGVIADRK